MALTLLANAALAARENSAIFSGPEASCDVCDLALALVAVETMPWIQQVAAEAVVEVVP